MRGALIETEARRLKDQAEKENARKTAQTFYEFFFNVTQLKVPTYVLSAALLL